MKKWLLLLMTPLVLGACDKDDTSRTEIWTIAPEKGVAGITMGFGYIPAYIVQKGANASWEIVPRSHRRLLVRGGLADDPARTNRPNRQPAGRRPQ